jgi:caffeoyl-CoA O-methyltransferase
MKHSAAAILRPEQAAYLDALEPPRDALLARMEGYARRHGHPISDPEVASFLAATALARAPKRIVELGTNIGYGAIVLARAAGPEARVVTIELDHELCKTARGYIEEAGLASRVEVRQGAAVAELEKIGGPVDMAYIDCVKEEYPRYLELLVPRLSSRGVIVADNVLWSGHVASEVVPEDERARTAALRAFNRALVDQKELYAVVLPLGDGVAFAVKKE